MNSTMALHKRIMLRPSLSILCIYLFFISICSRLNDCHSFIFQHQRHQRMNNNRDSLQKSPSDTKIPNNTKKIPTRLSMADHSCATIFTIGEIVSVTEDVLKAGTNLKGLSGEVIQTWEKCDVDPTCCCAEFVDEGMAVHVRFNVEDVGDVGNQLFANDTFIHYFAESELIKKKQENVENQQSADEVAFDGMSCKAFKLGKLSMGAQAKRIAAFEASQAQREPKEA